MTLIDGDRIVTAQLYDDEHEEFTEKKMSIIDFANAYTDEGVTMADDVLDKMKAEFINRYPKNYADELELGGSACHFSLNEIFEIIDKYRNEVRE